MDQYSPLTRPQGIAHRAASRGTTSHQRSRSPHTPPGAPSWSRP